MACGLAMNGNGTSMTEIKGATGVNPEHEARRLAATKKLKERH